MPELTDKIPPQALEAEKAVLGAMLIEKEAVIKATDILNDSDFYESSHRKIFAVIRDLYMENHAIDAVTVAEGLKRRKCLDDVGGATYITALINSVSTAANVEHYADIVHEKSILRQLISTGSNMVQSALDEKNSAEEILDRSESLLYGIAQKKATKGFTQIQDLIHPTIEHLEKLYTDKKDVWGLKTHYADFDKMTAGLQKSELILIAARPSMGKTAFALNIAENIALKDKKAVAIFSLEMSKEALMLRLLCSAAKVNIRSTIGGYIATNNFTKLTTFAQQFASSPIYIDDSSNLSVMELRARARRLSSELKATGRELSLIIIDYIQMMRGASRTESRQQEMADISRNLKGLARDLSIPVIAVSQLSRKPEEKGREGKPQLSDLRESGALEQDADLVAFIYREGYYRRDDPDKEKSATLIIAKQRNGPTGDISLVFERDYTRFEDMIAIPEP
ncbi:MAG: replicative DNA helicase [Endomicrobiales bacterium]|nr:replicative DNA helicase [Endomicrobiales bacterium]